MKIVVCDDNFNIISEIKEMLNEYSAIKNVPLEISDFDNGNAVLESNDNYNIAILDVEMPDMNGIALGEELRKRNKQIVLIYLTAHS